jgi:hypothetical protein
MSEESSEEFQGETPAAKSLLKRLRAAKAQEAAEVAKRAGERYVSRVERLLTRARVAPLPPLPVLSPVGDSKFGFEDGCLKVKVQIEHWEDMEDDETEIQPYVGIHLEWLEEETEMPCVWAWWTDHYWNVLAYNLPGFLWRYCPSPDEVWTALLKAVNERAERAGG